MRPSLEIGLFLGLIAGACHAQASYTNPFAGSGSSTPASQMCINPGNQYLPSAPAAEAGSSDSPGGFPAPGYDPYARSAQNGSARNVGPPSASYSEDPGRPPYGNDANYGPGYSYGQNPYTPMPDASWPGGIGFPPKTAPGFPSW